MKINKLIIYPEEVLLHPSIPDAECLATMLVQQDSIPLIVHEKGKVKVSEQLSGSEQMGNVNAFLPKGESKMACGHRYYGAAVNVAQLT